MIADRLHLIHPLETDASISRGDFAKFVGPVVNILKSIATNTGAVAVDPLAYFCEGSVCRATTKDGRPKYMDSQHLRSSYAKEAATFIDQMILN